MVETLSSIQHHLSNPIWKKGGKEHFNLWKWWFKVLGRLSLKGKSSTFGSHKLRFPKVFLSSNANLTPNLSFGHNLCFNYPNGSCKPILDIYVLRAFQRYNEIFNLMGFDPCNCSLKIQESIRTPTPKVGAHLGMWGFILSHFLTLPGA
jgi:hypothetical protein